MIRVYRDVVREFEVVDGFQYGKSLANGLHTDFLQCFLVKICQYIPGDVVL